MGQEIDSRNFTREDRTAYRVAVRRCLDALERMLDERRFVEEDWKTGLELELALVGRDAEGVRGGRLQSLAVRAGYWIRPASFSTVPIRVFSAAMNSPKAGPD